MSKRNGKKPEVPVLDFSHYSVEDAVESGRLLLLKAKAEMELDIEAFDQADADSCLHMSRVIVSMPRDWLIDDAPKKIVWSEAGSLDYLAGDRFTDFLALMLKGEPPVSEIKFDIGKFSKRDKTQMSRINMKATKAVQDGDIEIYEETTEELIEFVSKYIIDIPRDWLVADAPGNFDFSNSESLFYVRGDLWTTLNEQLGNAVANRKKK